MPLFESQPLLLVPLIIATVETWQLVKLAVSVLMQRRRRTEA